MKVDVGGRDALIVVDVQNDFCPGGSLPVPEGDRVMPAINRAMRLFPVVAASQDWHPRGHVSFASSHPGRKPFDAIEIDGRRQVLWPDHCVPGTRGAELHPDLDVRSVRLIVRKGWRPELDSYSVFFENDHSTPTGLDGYLRNLGVRRVCLAGLAQDICVYFSALDALRLGFEVLLLEDGSRGLDQPPGSLRERMEELGNRGMRRTSSGELAG
jgi:nicotinamidase/pyrazinamidase